MSDKLKVFVYGTLKRGHGNHRFCESASKIEKASVHGSLFRSWSLPYASIPWKMVIGQGSVREADLKLLQAACKLPVYGNPRIFGELVTFDDWDQLESLDMLEGYRYDGASHYERVLTQCVTETGGIETCWIYVIGNKDRALKKIESGVWQP
ncbi:MAG: gamma-glutamylcyclotransferase [SAR324 cluster bacterium]|nr:gamma-glutamylcyclotransferase [SAR324 cluster bacterium]